MVLGFVDSVGKRTTWLRRCAVVTIVSAVTLPLLVGTGGLEAATTTKKSTRKTTEKTTAEKTTIKKTTKKVTETSKAGAAGGGATTTIDVRPVSESSTTKKPGPTSSTVAPKALKGPIFIPGAGRVLDLGANEVAKLANGGRVEADVRGASGLAASGIGAVILDVTVTNPTTAGRVTLTPVAPDFARSVVQASVGFQPGSTTVSRVAVPVGAGGLVKVATNAGPSGLAISVVGWVVNAPAGVVEPSAIAMESCRILDTATGTGGLSGEVNPSRPFDLPAVGIAKVPPALAATGPTPIAVILSITSSAATGPLELRVVPTGSESPEMKLFMSPGQTTTSNFVVPVGADARVAFYVNAAATQIAVDVVGWLDRDNVVKSGGPC